MGNNNDIFNALAADIQKLNISEADKQRLMKRVVDLRSQKIHILITGGTGAGKSSTINALFDRNLAKVGVGSTPETMDIQRYELGNLVLWDSPGFGDGRDADARHAKNIIRKLREEDDNGYLLIDLVLVILDGSSRDYGTAFDLINHVIIPNLGDDADKAQRILVAINQCDIAMKGKHWNYGKNIPDPTLVNFLEEKVKNVQERIKASTSVDITPIYYSAGYKESNNEKQTPYNLSKLLYYIIQNTPQKKRLAYVDTVSKEKENWESNERYNPSTDPFHSSAPALKNYNEKIKVNLFDAVLDYIGKGLATGVAIGSRFGAAGAKIGAVAGAVAGGIWALVERANRS